MWVMTTQGFYSAVEHRDDPEKIMIRARVKADLTALGKQIPGLRPYRVRKSDYPWRAVVSRDEWTVAMAVLADAVDYDNFKDAVEVRQGKVRAQVYMSVWSALHGLSPRRLRKHTFSDPEPFNRPKNGEDGCEKCGVFLLKGERKSNGGDGTCDVCVRFPYGASR